MVHSLLGLLVLTVVAWLLSEDRRTVPWRLVGAGLLAQLLLAAALLKVPAFTAFFAALNDVVAALERATRAGTSFVFGYLGGAPAPFAETGAGSSFVLGFRALPLILVISALSAVLFHWRVLPLVVRGFAWALGKTLGIGGALGLGTAANVFLGMVESPLLVRPYLARMGRNELFALMTAGMATVAGTVMALYASILGPAVPGAMGHILTASLISAPAALMVAGLMVPGDGRRTDGDLGALPETASTMDAITGGTVDGLRLLAHIVAMLVVLVALVSLANQLLGLLPGVGGEALSLQRLLGWAMAPVVWVMGVPWDEAVVAGSLMGTKTVLNELLAYLQLAEVADQLSPRTRLMMTYALCGFANFGSLGILIGGMGAMVPERRDEIVRLGMRSIVAGTLATLMTGAVVGVLV
ncbi:MAG: nucleoside:proton symporter [Gammaproteobacteria bacterium]|jgi:CNT family concentrative nucleoside transporter|nr:nucleoside:proton symporter [Gammaproteobacteria bacterium]